MTDTICAPATAAGGALTIVRISGEEAIDRVSAIFSHDLTKAQPRTVHYGHIHTPEGDIVDEVLVSIFRAPHSYTGENAAEITLHGSPYIAQTTLRLLIEAGCRMAEPGEFTKRAFMHGRLDLTQAEAVADLIASRNAASHRVAMTQLRGAMRTELENLRQQLLHLTTLLELELDFSDHEDLEFAPRNHLLQLTQQLHRHVQALADTFSTGDAIKNGIPVAIVGAPNVGKSTLLNALLGEQRAIVSDIEGTTRDTIEDTVLIGQTEFRFIDTAGLRHTADSIEQLGQERTRAAAERAHIIIMLTEPGVPFPTDITPRSDQTVLRIVNKTDTFRAIDGTGLDTLRRQLADAAPHLAATDVVVTSARHYEALLRAADNLARVEQGLSSNLTPDLVAEDLRHAIAHLGDITGGAITPQETLINLFSHFCVGK